ncbi:MAG: peptide chain release factor N(5)-glutamine methyltransferase [Pseudomonadota bacterium]
MTTVQELLRCGDDLPGDSARRDCEILLGHCLSRPRSWLYARPEHPVDTIQVQHYLALLERRRSGQPIAYLLGRREFWSLSLIVNEHTLIPRPETELLVQWALELPLPNDASVLDMGTGSGAIALALAMERTQWDIWAVDVSADALAVACKNAQALQLQQVHFLQSNWYRELYGKTFDLIISNPPYVDPQDEHLRGGDIRFEPRSALVASDAGLADLSALINNAKAHLVSGGWMLLEHGFEQGGAVRDLFQSVGMVDVTTRRDLAGHERATGAVHHAH